MAISEEQVRYVATLARLAVTDEQVATLAVELSSILEHVGTIAQLDLDGVQPTAHAIAVTNRVREDVPTASLPREIALLNAPEARDGAFVIPKIG
jgi:aspartyl-tRNA(Asn)/glutamyl-tRNA(Gln) amidotransferase subunit C